MTAQEAREITDQAKAEETWVDCMYSKIQNDIKIAANFGSGGVFGSDLLYHWCGRKTQHRTRIGGQICRRTASIQRR